MLTNDAKMLTLGDQFRASWQRKQQKIFKTTLQKPTQRENRPDRAPGALSFSGVIELLMVENKHKSNRQKIQTTNHVNGDRFRFKIKMLEIFNHG